MGRGGAQPTSAVLEPALSTNQSPFVWSFHVFAGGARESHSGRFGSSFKTGEQTPRISRGFVLFDLPSFARNRLVRKRVPFIVPHRQMFLPPDMIDLREVHGVPRDEVKALSAPAQLMLLHHLQNRKNEQRSLSVWADILGYSK